MSMLDQRRKLGINVRQMFFVSWDTANLNVEHIIYIARCLLKNKYQGHTGRR